MAYSCSDFTTDLTNHLFANGFIPEAVAQSDDLKLQAVAAMSVVTNLAHLARKQLSTACSPKIATASVGRSLAAQFMTELLEGHETLTGIAEYQGIHTLADCMYLLSAIMKGTSITVEQPSDSLVAQVVKSLPSADLWMRYVLEVSK